MTSQVSIIQKRSDLIRYVHEHGLAKGASPRVIQIMMTLDSEMVKNVSLNTLTKVVNKARGEVWIVMGLQTPIFKDAAEEQEYLKSMLLLAAQIAQDLQIHCPTITLGEVEVLFNLYARGYLGDYSFISVKSVSQASNQYLVLSDRLEAYRLLNEASGKMNGTELSDEQKDQNFRELMCKHFDEFLESLKVNPDLDYVPNAWFEFDYLQEKKIHVWPKGIKDVAYREALKLDLVPTDVENMITANNISKETLAVNRAKEMLLAELYKELIGNDKHIKYLL